VIKKLLAIMAIDVLCVSCAKDRDAIRILRLSQVLDVTGLGKTKIYELQAAGHFPMRVQITDHSVGWIEHEVQSWLAQRVAARPIVAAGPERARLA
jgi:prophage regulatory protein